jgi:hypothetical protein
LSDNGGCKRPSFVWNGQGVATQKTGWQDSRVPLFIFFA